MKYFIIGDEDSVLGFGLAGVEGRTVSSSQEADAAFQAALADTDVGIILINENAADQIRSTINQYLFSRSFPLILEIPGRAGRDVTKPKLKDLVNEAIGITL